MDLEERLMYSARVRSVRRFLDEHWIVRWFVAPILFCAVCVLLLGLFLPYTVGYAATIAVSFAVLSFAVVAVGLAVGYAVAHGAKRLGVVE